MRREGFKGGPRGTPMGGLTPLAPEPLPWWKLLRGIRDPINDPTGVPDKAGNIVGYGHALPPTATILGAGMKEERKEMLLRIGNK
eukprot:567224-Amphidinium_carterae.1